MPAFGKTRRQRADLLLVEAGIVESRAKARALIMAGKVFLPDGVMVSKAGLELAVGSNLEVRGGNEWVSRGALKLDHALEYFQLDVSGKVSLDVGASTGGFTEILLHHGASRVYAVDTGRGQIAWKLRTDARVILHENMNARYITPDDIPEPIDVIVCDVSFISLEKILPALFPLAGAKADMVLLIKPQFEAGREKVEKGGIIRDAETHRQVCARLSEFVEASSDWTVAGLCESPIKGAKGNKEFLLHATRCL